MPDLNLDLKLRDHALQWLSKDVFPLWIQKGLDREYGGFHENLSLSGDLITSHKRTMVQARQIYSFRIGAQLGVCDQETAKSAIESGADFMMKAGSLLSGGFRHAATTDGKPSDDTPDLYAQAFALFGLGHAFAMTKNPDYKSRAVQLIGYLKGERAVKAGGFTEVKGGTISYASNPHMHLFEACLTWAEEDSEDPRWLELATHVVDLCLTRFIDKKTGTLAEYFNPDWTPIQEGGKHVFETGHQYEWSWLMGRYEKLSGRDLGAARKNLVNLSEKFGICPKRRAAIDENWSDGSPKKLSARFWPQTERVKAVVSLKMYGEANEALTVLNRYLTTPCPGTWYDSCDQDGKMNPGPVKSSSLYHIIGAQSEFVLNCKNI